MILPKEGYNVQYTSDSTKAVHYARKHNVDLLLLDLMMPVIDGYEVCRRVRMDSDVGEVPIMIVSAAGGKEVVRKVFEAGADDHIVKPFDQQDLLYKISCLIEKRGRAKAPENDGEDQGGDRPQPGS
jgi:DNA-binding response OmpR family regulator